MPKMKLSILSGGGVKTYLTLSGIVLLLLVALVPDMTLAAPATTTYNWQAKNGEWSGMFNDPDHWSPVGVPSATNMAFVSVGQNTTVTLPGGEYDTLASLKFNVTTAGSTLTWNGADTIFRQVTSEQDNYPEEPFGFRKSGSHFFNFQTYDDPVSSRYKQALSTISNGVFRLSFPSSGNVKGRIDFDSGFYNFYTADGVTATSKRYFIIGQNSAPNGDAEINFHPGTHVVFPAIQIPNNLSMGSTLSMNFLGGEHEIRGTFETPTAVGYTDKDAALAINVTNNASLKFYELAKFGTWIASSSIYYEEDRHWGSKHAYRFNVSDGGELTFNGNFTHENCGRLEMNVGDGGILAFNGTDTKIGGQYSTGVVTVARGGRLTGNLALGCGAYGHADLNVDGGVAELSTLDFGMSAAAEASIVITNGAQVSSDVFNLRSGTFYVPDGLAVTTGTTRIGYETGAKARMVVSEGSTFRVLRQLDVGSKNGEGTLDILGGTVWQRNPTNNALYMYIANNSGSTGTVNLVSGLLKARVLYCGRLGPGTFNISGGKFEAEDSVYFPYSSDSAAYGTINVTGGQFYVGYSLGIGHSNPSEMNVSGGEVSALYIFLGQGAKTDSSQNWAVLRQTGGYIQTRKGNYDKTVGVKLADGNGRNTRLILEGGRLRTHRIFGNCSRAAGGTGYAAFYANGGTVEVPFASQGLIDLLDEAKLGPKGLTVNGNYNCTIPQSFTDADDAPGEGLLVLAGPAVKTITATNSTVARLDIVDGTALFTTNALGQQAVQYSAITVTNNATLSLEGAQTSLTVRSLVLGANTIGRMKLDPGDVIRVEGALTVNSGILQVSEGFAIGNEYEFIELPGAEDRSAELSAALNLLQVTSPASGRGYTFRTEYDQATGKTTAKVVVEEMPEPGVTAWRGPGMDWADGANWSEGVPGLADIALFDSETAPATVTVTGKKLAGGLVFNAAQGYTLAGGGISVQSTDETRIDATQGVHVVESRLWLPDGMPVTVASGAGLTFGGATIGSELIKHGAGRLAITNEASGLGSLTVTGGTLAVTSPEVLAGVSAVTLKVGALELGGTAGTDTRYATSITLVNPIATNALMLRTPHDVTISDLTVTEGLPYKDGPGRLTLENGGGTRDVSVGDGVTTDWYPLRNANNGLINYDADGLVTDGTVLAGLTVAEGELVLRGISDNVTFRSKHYMTVGVPGATVSAAPPALTVDHATLDNKQDARHLILGGGLMAGNSTVTDIYLTATNGAEVSCNTLYVARGSSLAGVTHHILVDASTLSSSYRTHANCNSGTGSTAEFLFRNGSRFFVGGSLNMPYRSTFVFDDSIMAKNSSLDLASLTYKADYNAGNYTRAGGDFTFRNGSTLYLNCGAIDINSSQATSTSLTFDNSEWIPVKNADCTFAYPYPAKVGICTENTGLILTVPENRTWTMGQAVKGTGGLVKRGAGTLVFETHKIVSGGSTNDWANATTTLDFTGTLAVESGKVVVKSGAAAAGAKFSLASGTELDLDGGTISVGALSGTGAVKNGTVTGTIPLTLNDDWTVAEDLVAFDAATVDFGRVVVDLGRTAANPVTQPFGTVVVGRYTGDTPPDVRRWRVTGAGMDGVAGTFTAADGEIRMTLRLKGVFISFR